jgi:hypothetical protein
MRRPRRSPALPATDGDEEGASRTVRGLSLALVLVAVVTLAVLPVGSARLGAQPSFVPVMLALVGCFDLLSALFLLRQFLGSEHLLVGLRANHPLAAQASIDLRQREDQTLGMHPVHLFPAWHAVQRHILAGANFNPPIAELDDLDLAAHRWAHQPEIDWIMLINSFTAGHGSTVVRPALGHAVPFTLSWHAQPTMRPVVRRFIESSLRSELPDGWLRPPQRSSVVTVPPDGLRGTGGRQHPYQGA